MSWNWNKFVIGLALGFVLGPLVMALLRLGYDWLTRSVDAHRRKEARRQNRYY